MSNFSDWERQQIKAAFTQFDEDKSGTIDGRELPNVLEAMHYQHKEEALQSILGALGLSSGGEIE